jgi:hypothetical protein
MGLFETPRGERAVTGSVGMRGLKPRYLALKPQTSPEMPIFQPTLQIFFSADDGNDSGATGSSDAAAWQELTDAQKAQMAAAFGLELGGAPS